MVKAVSRVMIYTHVVMDELQGQIKKRKGITG